MMRPALLAALLALVTATAQAQRPPGQAIVGNTATYTAPDGTAIVTANVAVTVFAANTVRSGCDIVNTGAAVLYVDMTTTAVAGSATAIPVQPQQAWHCPYPPAGAVSAVASQAQPFVAVRY